MNTTRDYAAEAMEVLSETYSAEHVNAVKRAVRKTWRAASFCMSRVDDGTPFGREYHMAINDLTGEQRLFRTRDEADKFVNEKNA